MFRPKILITGASGFIGKRLMERLFKEGTFSIRACSRKKYLGWSGGVEAVTVPAINVGTEWEASLEGCEAVVHLAAKMHEMRNQDADTLLEFRRINVEGTLNLAKQAADCGVRRFVFLSSVKVHGESTMPDQPFTMLGPPNPEDAYALSKWEAEQGLRALEMESGMEVTILRPSLVYGPEVSGNFGSLLRWLKFGIPLPFGSINNRRSLVALDNLVDLIITCIDHPNGANKTFLVSDGEDLSTTQLLRRTAMAMGVTERLLPIPPPLLDLTFRMLGKPELSLRLLESLQVDLSFTKETLSWIPPLSVEEGLLRAVEPLIRK